MRILTFQQITDSRFIKKEECLPTLENRIRKIKGLLNIDGVEVKTENPYLIDWKDHIQYRVNFQVKKYTRKITWNDIYGLTNSVKAVHYKFI